MLPGVNACGVAQLSALLPGVEQLHRDYRVGYFFWELLELTRRTILTGWVLLIPPDSLFLRLVLALLISIGSFALLLSTRPYARPEDNLLAAGCQLTLIFIFVGAGYTKLLSGFGEYVSLAVVTRVMYFQDADHIAGPLLVITFAMLVVMAIIMFGLIRQQGNLPTIRLVSTGMPPELTVVHGHKWHLFLSQCVAGIRTAACRNGLICLLLRARSVWSTGQDANATIKRQLQRLLLGVSVFLE